MTDPELNVLHEVAARAAQLVRDLHTSHDCDHLGLACYDDFENLTQALQTAGYQDLGHRTPERPTP